MVRDDIIIKNIDAVTNRQAAHLVSLACKYASRVQIGQGNKIVNAKSMMGVLSLGFAKGDHLTIIADGTDEKEAAQAIINLIESGIKIS